MKYAYYREGFGMGPVPSLTASVSVNGDESLMSPTTLGLDHWHVHEEV